MSTEQLIDDVIEKYGEWLEMSDDAPTMLIDILANLLIKERAMNDYYKKVAYVRIDSK
jgi:hypothetical protein